MCEWLEWWTDDHKVIDSSLHSDHLMRHKDVKTVVDWLFSVILSQSLHPKQIQPFNELFCLNDDVIIMCDLALVKQNKKNID